MSKQPISFNQPKSKDHIPKNNSNVETNEQLNSHNRAWYLLYIGIAIAFMIVIGNVAAENIAPPPIENQYYFDLQNFTTNTEVENINNKQNVLIRETELMLYTTTITSKVSEPTRITYFVSIYHAGVSSTFDHQNAVEIEAFGTKKFTTKFSLPKAGINLVTLHFELHEDRSNFGVSSGSGLIEEQDLEFYHRVLTESDYNFQLERKLLYQFLWITAAPFVIFGIKGLRDIIQNK